jgi:hypothetical protein
VTETTGNGLKREQPTAYTFEFGILLIVISLFITVPGTTSTDMTVPVQVQVESNTVRSTCIYCLSVFITVPAGTIVKEER